MPGLPFHVEALEADLEGLGFDAAAVLVRLVVRGAGRSVLKASVASLARDFGLAGGNGRSRMHAALEELVTADLIEWTPGRQGSIKTTGGYFGVSGPVRLPAVEIDNPRGLNMGERVNIRYVVRVEEDGTLSPVLAEIVNEEGEAT